MSYVISSHINIDGLVYQPMQNFEVKDPVIFYGNSRI